MSAISRKKIKLWIVPTDTAASVLDDSASTAIDDYGYIAGEIKNYAKSGGEADVETDPHFGGYVDKEKPAGQVEITFEVTPNMDYADRWDAMSYSLDSSTGVYTMAGSITDRAVFIQAYDSTASKYKSWGFNNCNVTLNNFSHNADDNLTTNMTLKFSPTTDTNVSNFMTKATAMSSMPAWTALDNN